MPDAHLHFPKADTAAYRKTWDAGVRCAVMQGGQGDVKHWAFNDPLPRKGKYKDAPPSPEEYRKLATRVVDLHPLTIAQNARTSGGGNISMVPTKAITVGPVETWKAEKVSIWHAGNHDNPFGQRLTAFMISKGIVDTARADVAARAIIRTCSSTTTAAGSAPARWRCTKLPPYGAGACERCWAGSSLFACVATRSLFELVGVIWCGPVKEIVLPEPSSLNWMRLPSWRMVSPSARHSPRCSSAVSSRVIW